MPRRILLVFALISLLPSTGRAERLDDLPRPPRSPSFAHAPADAIGLPANHALADLASRMEDLAQRSLRMKSLVGSCSVGMDLLDGSKGFQIESAFLDCEWLRVIAELVERYRREYPVVNAAPLSVRGGQFLMQIGIGSFYRFMEADPILRDVQMNGRADLLFKAQGWGLQLRVTYPYFDHLSRVQRGEWKAQLRYDLPGRSKPGDLTPDQLRPQVDALIASFFAETAAKHFPSGESDQPQSTMKVEDLKLPENVSVSLVNHKLLSGWPQISPIVIQRYLPSLLEDIQDYFTQTENALPVQVGSMRIQLMHSCIRDVSISGGGELNRNNPSLYGPCFPGSMQVVAAYLEVYNPEGEKILYMVQSGPGMILESNMGYIDTIPLPYERGLFQIMMKRINAEIATVYRAERPSRARHKNAKFDFGPIKRDL